MERGGRTLALARLIAVAPRLGGQCAQRTRRLVGLRLPEQSVALAPGADDLLRVLQHAVAVQVLRGVLSLSVHVGQTYLDRLQLVAADPAPEDLLPSPRDIEAPPLGVLHDRNGERPVVLAQMEDSFGLRDGLQPAGLVVRLDEAFSCLPVADGVTGGDDALAARPQDPSQRCGVVRPRGLHERLRRFVRRLESHLLALGREGDGWDSCEQRRHEHDDDGNPQRPVLTSCF